MIRKEDCKNCHSWLETQPCECCLAYWRFCVNCNSRQLMDCKGICLKEPKEIIKQERRNENKL